MSIKILVRQLQHIHPQPVQPLNATSNKILKYKKAYQIIEYWYKQLITKKLQVLIFTFSPPPLFFCSNVWAFNRRLISNTFTMIGLGFAYALLMTANTKNLHLPYL